MAQAADRLSRQQGSKGPRGVRMGGVSQSRAPGLQEGGITAALNSGSRDVVIG